ncbi:MAG TPA: ATP-dependent DNA helicase [Candidatus Paceibacterota bacterium]
MKEDSFNKLYNKLNPEQKEAVDTIEGPVMVVAGPGTGKTQVLTLRIANILQRTDTAPENILALTFTEAAAVSMRRRLAEIIGSPAYSVVINTFHGFCNDIIKNYPEYFPRIMNSVNITEVDQINIIKEFVGYRLKDFLKKINDFKKDGISPKETEQQNPKIAKIYTKYELELKKQKLYDYNDMIIEVLRALKKEKKLLQTLQEQYHYVLADEHQDVNKSQNKIIEVLMEFHQNPNIFVVGDEKQAIYRFQGASLENFLFFKNKYPEAKTINLVKNYRSQQTILDGAQSIFKEKKLFGQSSHAPKKLQLLSFSRPEVEAYFLAQNIKRGIKSGIVPNEITVLYRNNKDAFLYSEFLEKMKVPFAIESDMDILTDPDIKKITTLLSFIAEPDNFQKLISALHVDFINRDVLTTYKVAHLANQKKILALEALKEKIPQIYSKIASWITYSKNLNFTEFFQKLLQESGFLAHILQKKDAADKVNKLNSLFDEIKMLSKSRKNYSLSDFMSYLEALEKHDVLIKKSPAMRLKKNVRLMTAHKSKGQEFEYVHIVGVNDGHWGGGFNQSDDDERRLFYVALTRAKKELNISYARENELQKEQLPSRFIKEINPKFIETQKTEQYEKQFEKNKKIIFTPAPQMNGGVLEKEFTRELFLDRGLSVTALNNFLSCPWKYFYVNLLRIPKAPSPHQIFGIAVHSALKELFLHKNELEKNKEKTFLLDSFERNLKQNALSQNDFEELLLKGENSLPVFYENRKNEWSKLTIPELNIKISFAPGITLKGQLDKLEFLENNKVNVVDYKTGKAKTRNEIEGLTKNSNGDIKRQLVFYNLLLNKYKSIAGRSKFEMVSGEVDFVEPDEKGRNRKEKFVITPNEITELESVIKKTANEITSLSFINKRCLDKKCEWCALRNMMS